MLSGSGVKTTTNNGKDASIGSSTLQEECMISFRIKLFVYIYALLFSIVSLLDGCATIPIEQRLDYRPMYGQPEIPRPEHMIKADEAFIRKASKAFGGSREEASIAWMMEGERFMQQGDFYNAMRRYNQSWLLNSESFYPYWGFGRVMVQRYEFDEAIKYFEKAKQLIEDDFERPALLSDTGSAYSFKAQSIKESNQDERAKYFAIANQHFKEATQYDSTYTEGWKRWAYSLFAEGEYALAWEKVHKAKANDITSISSIFLDELELKMESPNN